jgi:hypothetical protein
VADKPNEWRRCCHRLHGGRTPNSHRQVLPPPSTRPPQSYSNCRGTSPNTQFNSRTPTSLRSSSTSRWRLCDGAERAEPSCWRACGHWASTPRPMCAAAVRIRPLTKHHALPSQENAVNAPGSIIAGTL